LTPILRAPLSRHLDEGTTSSKRKAETVPSGPGRGKKAQKEPVRNTAALERIRQSQIKASKVDADIVVPAPRFVPSSQL